MCWRSGHVRIFIPCPPVSGVSRREKVDWNAEGRRWPDKDKQSGEWQEIQQRSWGGGGEAVGAWGPRTGNVNQEVGQWVQERERSWLTRRVGEADLLIRLEKKIVNGKQWEQGMSVKNWLDPREEGGREGGREWLEDRQGTGLRGEAKVMTCRARKLRSGHCTA